MPASEIPPEVTRVLPLARRPSLLLSRTGRALSAQSMPLRQALDALSAGGFGFVLAVLATPNLLPSPGVPLGVMLGIPLLLLAAQYACGAERPSMPAWLDRQHRVVPLLGRAMRWLAPRVRWWERKVGHRPLGRPTAARRVLAGGWVMLMAALIILPIPFGNTLPALSALLVGGGLFLNDRTTVGLGFAAGVAAIAFAVAVVLGGVQLLEWLLR